MTTQELRNSRRDALRAARDYLAHLEDMSPQMRLQAALDLSEYGTFNASLLARWFNLSPTTLRRTHGLAMHRSGNWGIERLAAKDVGTAYELTRAGALHDRPKTLIFAAHQDGLSFVQIGALLGIHKQQVNRIVKRIIGERPY